MRHQTLGFAAWLLIVYKLWRIEKPPVPFAERTARPCRANWLGLRCQFNLCGFRPNNIAFSPIGGHCDTPGCERQIVMERNWRPGPRWLYDPKPAPVRPKDNADAE